MPLSELTLLVKDWDWTQNDVDLLLAAIEALPPGEIPQAV